MRIGGELLLLSWAWAWAGCSSGKSERAIRGEDLPGAGVAADGTGWESAPFPTADDCAERKERWLKLERKSQSDGLVISHGLDRTPSVVIAYTSPRSSGCGSTVGAGDAVVIDYADEEKVKVHNNTMNDLFIRLVLL